MPTTRPPTSDLDELYRRLAPRLLPVVRANVRTSEAVVEDACQIAWSRLVERGEEVRREAALSWLATTAIRIAFRLARRDAHDLSLDAELEQLDELPPHCVAPDPFETVALREGLAAAGRLPERQRRLVWMQAVGFTYPEMAARTGETRRTVERQLLRGKERLAREAA